MPSLDIVIEVIMIKNSTPISEDRASRVLRRAAEIDRTIGEQISLGSLREAAAEAGISELSFNTALTEELRTEASSPPLHRRRWLVGALGAIALAAILMRVIGAQPTPSIPVETPDTPLVR